MIQTFLIFDNKTNEIFLFEYLQYKTPSSVQLSVDSLIEQLLFKIEVSG